MSRQPYFPAVLEVGTLSKSVSLLCVQVHTSTSSRRADSDETGETAHTKQGWGQTKIAEVLGAKVSNVKFTFICIDIDHLMLPNLLYWQCLSHMLQTNFGHAPRVQDQAQVAWLYCCKDDYVIEAVRKVRSADGLVSC